MVRFHLQPLDSPEQVFFFWSKITLRMRRAQEAHTNKEEARVFDLKGNALCSERDSSILHAISYRKKKIGIRLRSENEHQRGKTN